MTEKGENILCTMPGRFGDILWALPAVRLLSDYYARPVDFMTSSKYSRILDLVQRQPYILETWTGEDWNVQETAPITPVEPPKCECDDYKAVHHLGYREWPEHALYEQILRNAELVNWRGGLRMVTWLRPWITVGRDPGVPTGKLVAVSFSEEHIELKMGVLLGVAAERTDLVFMLIVPPDPIRHRAWEWAATAGRWVDYVQADWVQTADLIARADLFLGCLSSSWVLANAVGTPTVIMEPAPERHHPIFWREASQNHLVRGADGKPTFDRRHVVEAIDRVLERVDGV